MKKRNLPKKLKLKSLITKIEREMQKSEKEEKKARKKKSIFRYMLGE